MLLIILAVLFLTAYVGVGAVYSRGRYANILAEHNQKRTDLNAIKNTKARMKELDEAWQEMQSTSMRILVKHHTIKCDKYLYSHIGVCNCGANKRNRAEYAKQRDFIEGTIDEPAVAGPVMFWPAYMLSDFVKSGEPSNQELARQMKELREAEHNARIAKLRAVEAEALDRELALAQKR